MTIRIREMCGEDVETLSQAFCFPWTTLAETTEKWRQAFSEQEKGNRTICLLKKREESEIIGYGTFLRVSAYPAFREGNIPEIHDVWVAESERGKGVGTQLIRYFEEMARKEGHSQIGIGVGLYGDYGSAQRLYVQLGYLPDGRGATYKGKPVVPGKEYPVDDDLVLWFVKSI